MRIITGLYKGRVIKTVNDLSVRPATDRVKKTIFDMLSVRIDFDGIHVLDLFAGSGNLGIEALSRGAAKTVFVETGAEAMDFIEENIRMLGCESATEFFQVDALSYIRGKRQKFDLVFADPPYKYEHTAQLPELIFASGILNPGGYLLIEHSSDFHFESTILYKAGPEKKFGRTLVTFFQHPQ